jgi:hypothetical protein
MKIVNRGFLIVRPKQAFCDWAKTQDPEFIFDEVDDIEPSVYLVDEDIMEVEPLIEQSFKSIFLNECEAVTEDDDAIPAPTMELFESWFTVEYGGCVYDKLKTNLLAE